MSSKKGHFPGHLGTGERFEHCVHDVRKHYAEKGYRIVSGHAGPREANPRAVCAAIGRGKYGPAKFQKLARHNPWDQGDRREFQFNTPATMYPKRGEWPGDKPVLYAYAPTEHGVYEVRIDTGSGRMDYRFAEYSESPSIIGWIKDYPRLVNPPPADPIWHPVAAPEATRHNPGYSAYRFGEPVAFSPANYERHLLYTAVPEAGELGEVEGDTGEGIVYVSFPSTGTISVSVDDLERVGAAGKSRRGIFRWLPARVAQDR